MAKQELKWSNLKMNAKQSAAWDAVTTQRDKFEETVTTDVKLPDGKKLVFSYKYGKPSFAIADIGSTTNSKAETLQEYMARQTA